MPAHDHQLLDNDSTDALLTATGQGDVEAFAAFYDRTASTVFGMLRAGTQATERVYLSVWRAAPSFEPTRRSAYSTLMVATRRELARQLSGAALKDGPKDGPLLR